MRERLPEDESNQERVFGEEKSTTNMSLVDRNIKALRSVGRLIKRETPRVLVNYIYNHVHGGETRIDGYLEEIETLSI